MKNYTQFINENNEVKDLQKQLKDLDNWFMNNSYGTLGYKDWDKKAVESYIDRIVIRETKLLRLKCI